MSIQTGIAIGMIVLLSLVGLGIFMQLVGGPGSRRPAAIDVLKLLGRFLPKK